MRDEKEAQGAGGMTDMPGTDGRPARRPDHQIPRITFTILLAALFNSPLATCRLVFPMVAIAFGASAPLVGLIVSLMTAVPILFTVSFGRWVDRVGTLVPFAACGGLIILGSLLFIVVPSPYTLLAVSSLIGLGGMSAHVVAIRAVGDIDPPEGRTSRLGFLVLSYSVFQFAGPMLAAFLFEHYGSNSALLMIAGFGLAGCLGLLVTPHNYRRNAGTQIKAGAGGRAYELLKIPPLRARILVNGVFYGAISIFPVIISLHSIEVGISASQAGLILGAFAAGNAITRMAVGLVVRHFKAEKVLIVALVGSALAYAPLPLLDSVYPLMGLSLVLGLLLGLAMPVSLSLIYSGAPDGRLNETLGLSVAIGNFFQTVLPLMLGVLVSSFGSQSMVWLLSIGMIAASLLLRRN